MNILLTVAVLGLLIFFIGLLIKLNPSREKKEESEPEFEVERTELLENLPTPPQDHYPQPQLELQHQPPPARLEPPRVVEKPIVAVSPTTGGASVETKQEIPPRPITESRVSSRQPEKTGTQLKAPFVNSRKDCLHHFGYLRTFPKNSPIPDECFGCEKIVDCLVNNKKSNGKNERSR